MGKVIVLEETTRYPLSLIGKRSGICWNTPIDNAEKNIKRAKDCIESGHGRVLEFVNVELVLDGYSARVIREWYTHLAGSPTRLQQSTRYCEWNDNDSIVLPPSIADHIKNGEDKVCKAAEGYLSAFAEFRDACKEAGVPKEDIAMFYPLGMKTKIVDKRNLRNLVEMSHKRMCTRAYWEYRELMHDIRNELSKLSDEWKWVCDNLLVAQCIELGYCPEKKGCGFKGKR